MGRKTARAQNITESSWAKKTVANLVQSLSDVSGLPRAMKEVSRFTCRELSCLTMRSLDLTGLAKLDSAAVHSRIWLCCILTGHPRLLICEDIVEKVGLFITNLLPLRKAKLSDQDYDKLSRLLNRTILTIENCEGVYKETTRSAWIWSFLFVPLLSAAKGSYATHSSELFNWMRSALWLVKQHTSLPAVPLALSCISAIASLPATGAPGVFLFLEECLKTAAHLLRGDERTTLLQLCLRACKQPKACFLLKWQALNAIRQLTRIEENGASTLEVATVFSTGSTLPDILRDLLFDYHPLVRGAANEAATAICLLCEEAKRDLQERIGDSGSGDSPSQLQGEGHVGINRRAPKVSHKRREGIAKGSRPAKSWLDVVVPPPLPPKVEGVCKQSLSSSGETQPAVAPSHIIGKQNGGGKLEYGIAEVETESLPPLPISTPASHNGGHQSWKTSSRGPHKQSSTASSPLGDTDRSESSVSSGRTGFFANVFLKATSCFTGQQNRPRKYRSRGTSTVGAEASSTRSSTSLTGSNSSEGRQSGPRSVKEAAKSFYSRWSPRRGSQADVFRTTEWLQEKYSSPACWPQ